MKYIDISVVIPSYNSENTIGLCLDALFKQKCNLNYEIIVVDDSSIEIVANIVAEYKHVTFIRSPKRLGRGIGRNIGAKKARGEVIVFLDSDVILDANALAKIWDYYKDGYNIFNGALELANSSKSFLVAITEHYFFNHEHQKRRRLGERKNLSSALLIFKKELFNRVGHFKNISRAEDTELTERLYRKKIKLFFIPDVVGYQIQNASFKKVLKKIFISGNNIYYIRKYWRKKTILVFLLPFITFIKTTRINIRNMIYNGCKGNLIGFLVSPIIYYCGIFWMLGMYSAIFLNKGIDTLR